MNTLKVYVLDGPITRSYHDNVSYLFHVLVNEEAQVYSMYVKDQKGPIFEKVESGKCYMLLNAVKLNVDKGCFVKLKEVSGRKGDTSNSDVTKVYSIPLFTYNNAAFEGFFHAPVVPLKEVMRSPEKKRVSVTGRVANVSPLVAKSNWRRQELQLVDDNDSASKITVKLWNENAALINDGHIDKKIRIENVEIDSWGASIAVRDTCQTTVNEIDPEVVVEILAVDGVHAVGKLVGSEIASEYTLADACVEELGDVDLPADFTVRFEGRKIVEIVH